MTKNLKPFLLILLLPLASCGPGRPHLQTLDLNKEGNSQLLAQNYQTAMEKYLEALSYDPFAGEVHVNLGLTFEGTQQGEKALKSYEVAESLALQEKNYPLAFMARFNQAQLLGKLKKVDEALALYQKALELIPTSKEAKTNIELLTQSQQGGQGGGEGEDKNQDKQDQQQQQKDDKGQDKDEKENDKPKEVQQSPKYKPRPFQGKELSENDVKKILGELKQQEEKIRAEYNRKEMKERPRDKDW